MSVTFVKLFFYKYIRNLTSQNVGYPNGIKQAYYDLITDFLDFTIVSKGGLMHLPYLFKT